MAGPAIKLHARSHTHGVSGDGNALAPVTLDVSGHSAMGAIAQIDASSLFYGAFTPFPAILSLEEDLADTSAGFVDGLRVYFQTSDPANRPGLSVHGAEVEVRHVGNGSISGIRGISGFGVKEGSGNASAVYGLYFEGRTGEGPTGNIANGITGASIYSSHYGTGTCQDLVAVFGQFLVGENAGTVTDATCFYAYGYNYNVLEDYYGVWIATPINEGTIQNVYGLYIEPLTAGTITGVRRAIYVIGDDESYFGGDVLAIKAPTATPNRGVLNLGEAPWDGASPGFYTGHASGTLLAGNAVSGFAGNLIDMQVAGVPFFRVTGAGESYFGGPVLVPKYQQFTEMAAPATPAANNVRIYAEDNGGGLTRVVASFATGSPIVLATENTPAGGGSSISQGGGSVAVSASGGIVAAPAAGQLWEQRNGTNAQTLRVYGTFTDASNYRRAALIVDTVNNFVNLNAENAGTGAALGWVINAGNSKAIHLRMLGQGWQMDANRNWIADQASDIWMPGATAAMTAGFVYIPAAAGAPSGTPTNTAAARVPLYYDATNHKIYAYSGGTWRSTAALA